MKKVRVNHLNIYGGAGAKVQGYAIAVVGLLILAAVVYNIVANGIAIS